MLCSPGHARASVNTWRGIFEPSVNTCPEGNVKSAAVRKALKDSAEVPTVFEYPGENNISPSPGGP